MQESVIFFYHAKEINKERDKKREKKERDTRNTNQRTEITEKKTRGDKLFLLSLFFPFFLIFFPPSFIHWLIPHPPFFPSLPLTFLSFSHCLLFHLLLLSSFILSSFSSSSSLLSLAIYHSLSLSLLPFFIILLDLFPLHCYLPSPSSPPLFSSFIPPSPSFPP